MSCRLFVLFSVVFPFFAYSSNFGWEKLDNQESQLTKLIYQVEYEKAIHELELLSKKDDANAIYFLGLIRDSAAHSAHCNGDRNSGSKDCRQNGETYYFDGGLKYSFKKSKKWYSKAKTLGHPYAGYMLIKNYIHHAKPVPIKIKEDSLKTLNELRIKGDGVATYMYYDLLKEIKIIPNTAEFKLKDINLNLLETINKLKVEASQGRILALHYLGKAYSNKNEYEKSYAWFIVAMKYGFKRSGPSSEIARQLIENLDENLIVEELKIILNIVEQNKY